MIYLNTFSFPTLEDENDFRFSQNRTCYTSIYPYGILSKNTIETLVFEPITILYGGNGCGKSTALNVIAEKLKLERDNLYNKSNFFNDYKKRCRYETNGIPTHSRIITSDDVFDFTMNLRYLNEGLDRQRENLLDEAYRRKTYQFKMKSLDDYDEFKRNMIAQQKSQSEFVRQYMLPNVKEQSNGESGFMYFTSKIQNDALYLLDEPENSLSPEKQKELLQFIYDSARFYNCQFIIATHSPFLLSIKDAKIYDFDETPVKVKPWTELKNVREYYDFFKLHEKDFI